MLQKVADAAAEAHEDSSEFRIRRNVHRTLALRFREQIAQSQRMQSEMAAERQETALRQLQIHLPRLSREEAVALAARGVGGDSVMAEKLRQEDPRDSAQLVRRLHALNDRVADLRSLEKAVGEMQQFFVELQALVIHQGEMLDSIEHSVINTKNFVLKGKIALAKAKIKQHQAMKKRIWMLFCCIVLIILIVGPPAIIATVKQFSDLFTGADKQQPIPALQTTTEQPNTDNKQTSTEGNQKNVPVQSKIKATEPNSHEERKRVFESEF